MGIVDRWQGIVSARAAAATAAWRLRAYRGTAALLAMSGAVMLAAALPVAVLVRSDSATGALVPRLLLPPSRPELVETGWGLARSAASLRSEAVAVLFQALAGAALAAFAVGAVGMLLVFAAQAGERTGEVALRRAVGASRRMLFVAALVEGVALGALAIATGSGLGLAAARAAVRAWPGSLAEGTPFAALSAATAVALVLPVGAVLAVVFAPRRRLVDVAPRPLGLAAATLQLGLALVILTAGALMVSHSSGGVGTVSRPSGGQVFSGASAEDAAASRSERYAALLARLGDAEEFDSISLTGSGGVVGLGTVSVATTDCGLCPFGGLLVPWHSVPATHQLVSADSFQALGVHLVAGRGITDADRWDAPRVAVVSRGLAVRHFQDGDPIGRRMLLGDDPRAWHTVVGVVDDPPVVGLGGALLPAFTVYASVLQHPARNVELLVRPRAGRSLDPALAETVARTLAAGGGPTRMSEATLLAAQLAPITWFGRFFGVEGWAMLLLAATGTVAQMRLWVRSLAPELGLRRAVGARPRRIVGLVLARAALVGIGGVAVGLCLGPAVWSALGTIVRGLPAWDQALVLRYAALLVATTTLGALAPAWRASRAAPAELLAASGA